MRRICKNRRLKASVFDFVFTKGRKYDRIIVRRVIAMSDTERIIANVNATMAMEGMPLTKDDKMRIRDCLEGRKGFDETVKELVDYYRKAV